MKNAKNILIYNDYNDNNLVKNNSLKISLLKIFNNFTIFFIKKNETKLNSYDNFSIF